MSNDTMSAEEIVRGRIEAIKARLDKEADGAWGNADGFDPDMANSGLSVREVRFILAQLSASQQETRAAVEDVEKMLDDADPCDFCGNMLCHRKGGSGQYCEPKWRGPQEAEHGEE